MAEFLTGLGSWDYREAHRRISRFGEAEGVDEASLHVALSHVSALLTQYSAASEVQGSDGPITWHQYEHLIWALGESVRQILKRRRALRKSESLWQTIEALCLEPRYGKGRESFVMLLGHYGGQARVPILLQLLTDSEVQGHALYALRLLGTSEAIPEAQRLLGHRRRWIRQEARKYLAKVGQPLSSEVVT